MDRLNVIQNSIELIIKESEQEENNPRFDAACRNFLSSGLEIR